MDIDPRASRQVRAMKAELRGRVTKTPIGKLYGDIKRKHFVALEQQRREYQELFDSADPEPAKTESPG